MINHVQMWMKQGQPLYRTAGTCHGTLGTAHKSLLLRGWANFSAVIAMLA